MPSFKIDDAVRVGDWVELLPFGTSPPDPRDTAEMQARAREVNERRDRLKGAVGEVVRISLNDFPELIVRVSGHEEGIELAEIAAKVAKRH